MPAPCFFLQIRLVSYNSEARFYLLDAYLSVREKYSTFGQLREFGLGVQPLNNKMRILQFDLQDITAALK